MKANFGGAQVINRSISIDMRCGCVCPIVHTRQIIGFLVHHIQQLLNFIRTGKLKIETQNDRRLLARNQLYHQLGNYLNKYIEV